MYDLCLSSLSFRLHTRVYTICTLYTCLKHTQTHANTHTNTRKHTQTLSHTHTHTHTHTHARTLMYLCACQHVSAVHVYAHMRSMHVRACACARPCVHPYKHMCHCACLCAFLCVCVCACVRVTHHPLSHKHLGFPGAER